MSETRRVDLWLAAQEVGEWPEPNVAETPWGEFAIEWWGHGNVDRMRKLTVYFANERHVNYVQSWGPDMEEQMIDGEVRDNLRELLTWVYS